MTTLRPRTVIRALAAGPLLGAVVFIGLFILCIVVHRSAEYMGVEDTSVTDKLVTLFQDQINHQQLGLLAMYTLVGAIIGTLAATWVELLARVRQRTLTIRRRLLATLGLVVLVHALVTMHSMAIHPAVYAPAARQSWVMTVLFAIAVDGPPRWVFDLLLAGLGVALIAFIGVLAVRRDVHKSWFACAGLGLGIVAAFSAAPRRLSPSQRSTKPNVLVLAVDSMRADLLTTVGVIPNITTFARGATTFSRAIPAVPRTYPSWASMLTGEDPHTHGVRHMFPIPKKGKVIAHGLPDLLAAEGYRTAVVSDFAGDVFTRGDFGFQHVDAPQFTLASNVALGGVKLHVHLLPYLIDVLPDAGGYRDELLAFERLADPRWVEDAALDWLAEAPDQPWFLVAFFSAGHFPFAAPAPWWSRFADPSYRGQSRFLKETFGKHEDTRPAAAIDAEHDHLRDLYRGAVSASDAAIGDVLARLRAAGQLDNTIVIITADHGENLYEYGLGVGHGDHLYGRTTLEVPFVIDYPGNPQRGRTSDMPVGLIDLAPTVLGRLGLRSDAPPGAVTGVDVTTLSAPRPVFSEIDLWFFPPETDRLDGKRIVGVEGFDGFSFDPDDYAIYLDKPYQPLANLAKHRMVVDGHRKLLYIPTRDGVRFELYDPEHDPGDEHDLATREPATVERLKSELYKWMLADPTMHRVGDFVVPRDEARP